MKNYIKSLALQTRWAKLAALLLALSFPPVNLWPLSWIAYALFLYDVLNASSGIALRFFSFFVTTYVLGFYWISYTLNQFGDLPWIAAVPVMCLAFAFFSIVPTLAGWAWGRWCAKITNPIAKAASLGLAVFLIDAFDPRLFPWSPVMAMGENTLLLASVGTIGTLGWRIGFFGITTIAAALCLKDRKKALLLGPVLATVFCVIASFLGSHHKAELEARYPARQDVALLQGNIGNYEKKQTKLGIIPTVRNVLKVHKDLIDQVEQHMLARKPMISATQQSTEKLSEPWVFWPETSYPGLPLNNPADGQILHEMAKQIHGLHVVGTYESADAEFGGVHQTLDYNIIGLFHESQGYAGHYRKMIRLPMGEYIPGDIWFPNLYSLLPAVNHFGKGTEFVGLEHPKADGPVFIAFVCYEVLYRSHLHAFVEWAQNKYPNREIILVNPTNDSWYGPTSEPFQHSLLARWNIAELGLPAVRATNTGLSQVIAPWGEVLATGPRDETTVIFGELPVKRPYVW